MEEIQIFPQIVNVTDLRYRWSKVEEELEKGNLPIVVVEHSTPKAVIFSFEQAQKFLGKRTRKGVAEDPLIKWRKKYLTEFTDWDAITTIRKMRDSRWNLS